MPWVLKPQVEKEYYSSKSFILDKETTTQTGGSIHPFSIPGPSPTYGLRTLFLESPSLLQAGRGLGACGYTPRLQGLRWAAGWHSQDHREQFLSTPQLAVLGLTCPHYLSVKEGKGLQKESAMWFGSALW